MTFECDRCGICCQHIDSIPQLKEFDSGDGRCIHLLENNLCEIYLDRPDICNVEKMYEKYFKDNISEDEYIRQNMMGCNELKNRHGVIYRQ